MIGQSTVDSRKLRLSRKKDEFGQQAGKRAKGSALPGQSLMGKKMKGAAKNRFTQSELESRSG
jgi:hypothetical protein